MVLINGKEYTPEDIAALTELSKAIGGGSEVKFKNDPSSLTVNSNPPYGPYQDGSGYGVFSFPGMRPDMYSAFQRPYTLARVLGLKESLITFDKIGIMTGVTAGSGSNPNDFCGDFPVPGQLKRCVQNYIWGKYGIETPLNNIAEAGEYIDYADIDKRIANLAMSANPFMPDILQQLDISNRNGALLASQLFEIGVQFERTLEIALVRGNSALAPAATQLGFIREFNGLERQITSGKVDIDTTVACPGADSTVVTWGTGIDQTVNGRSFVVTLTDIFYQKQMEANRVGMADTQFVWVMSMKLFRALTYVWACQYYTYRCQTSADGVSTSNPSFTNAPEIRNLQLEMFQGRYLLVDGQKIPVVLTDGIRSTKASATVWTDDNLFLLPISWAGKQLLNLYYKKMDNGDAMEFGNFGGQQRYWSINNGMFLVTSQYQKFCIQHAFAGKFRLIQEAPFLAAVVNTIQYSYAQEYRDPFPGSSLHFDGGATRWDGNMTVT